MSAPVRAIVFDLDGTLVDGSADITRAMNSALVAAGAPPVSVAQVRSYLGGGPRALVTQCLGDLAATMSEEHVRAVLDRYSAEYRKDPSSESVLLGGAESFLPKASAAGVAMGICTNKRTDIADMVLRGLRVREHFGSLVGSDLARTPKPHPSHLLDVLDELSVGPGAVVYVGDTDIDRTTAEAAATRYAHVRWGHPEVQATLVLDSFDDLLSLL